MTKPSHIQGNKRPLKWLAFGLFMAACIVLAAPGFYAHAQDQENATVRSDDQEGQTLQSREPVRRPDNVFGTRSEGIRTGRNPDTGDTVIRVTPPEKPKEPEYVLPPVLVEPKVEFPYTPGQNNGAQGN
jgi:hypothetical protein